MSVFIEKYAIIFALNAFSEILQTNLDDRMSNDYDSLFIYITLSVLTLHGKIKIMWYIENLGTILP